jgi:Glycerophosphoryl diester phosphodiesterase family
VLIALHDDTLNRTMRGPAENCTGRADTKTLAQIKTCSADSLRKLHAMDARLPLVFLGGANINNLGTVREFAVGQGPSSGGVTQAFVDAAHAQCLDVHPYTVNDVTTMQRLIGYGVDGMFTNFPERLDPLLPIRYEGRDGAKAAAAANRACRERIKREAVGGTVPATLSLTMGAPASFGAFVPGVAREYTASTTATVVSSAADATLSVSDPGHLVNGAFSLVSPLQVELAKTAWTGPVSNETVPVTFRQSIGATEPLRTGAYAKTLTFTLSTTTP